MNNLLRVSLLTFIVSLSSSGFGQTNYHQPAFPSSTFPVGGFEFAEDINNLQIGPPGGNYTTVVGAKFGNAADMIADMLGAGFNTMWFNNGYSWSLNFAASAPSNMSMYPGDFGALNEWIGSLSGPNGAGKERRYFLASNWENTKGDPTTPINLSPLDIDRSEWANYSPTGDADFHSDPTNGGTIRDWSNGYQEWYVNHVSSINTQILQLIQGGASSPFMARYSDGTIQSVWGGRAADNDVNGNPNKAVILFDFIYRLSNIKDAPSQDDLDNPNFGDNDPLYTIAWSVYPNTTHSGTALQSGSVNVTRAQYKEYISAQHLRENKNILSFPAIPANQTEQYAVQRFSISVDNADYTTPPLSIAVNVTAANTNADIFIRGFRLRTQFMDNLENGLHDNPNVPGAIPIPAGPADPKYLSDFFNSLIDSWLIPIGGGLYDYTAHDRIQYITAGGELDDPSQYRDLAYVDNFLYHFQNSLPILPGQGPRLENRHLHILTFLQGALAWYRSVYEDETGALPVASMEEGGIDFGYQFWNNASDNGNATTGNDALIPVPADAMAYELLNHKNASNQQYDFQSFEAPITGYPDVTQHYWNHWNAPRDKTPTFDTYEIDLLAKYQLFNINEFAPAAASAYPPNVTAKSEQGKWWAFVPTIQGFAYNTVAGHSDDLQPKLAGTGGSTKLTSDLLTTAINNKSQCGLYEWTGNYPGKIQTPIHSALSYWNWQDTYHDIFAPRGPLDVPNNISYSSAINQHDKVVNNGVDALTAWNQVYP